MEYEWPVAYLPGKGHLELSRCRVTPDGCLLVGSVSESGGAFTGEGWVARRNLTGKERWRRPLGGKSDWVRVTALEPAPNGGCLVGGSRTWRSGEDARGFLVAISPRGKEQWGFEFGSRESNGLEGLLIRDRGSVYARHEYLPTGSGSGRDDLEGHDFFCGVDGRGHEVWRRPVRFKGLDRASIVQLAPLDDGFACLVAASIWGEGARDFPVVLFLDARGRVRQVPALRKSAIAEPIAIVPGGREGPLVLGGVSWAQSGKKDPVLTRVSRTGGLLWERHLGDPERDVPRCLAGLPDGGAVAGGVRDLAREGGTHPPPQAVWITRTDPRGKTLWERVFHSGHVDRLADLSVDERGRVLGVGSSRVPGEPQQAWALTLGADGSPEPWLRFR